MSPASATSLVASLDGDWRFVRDPELAHGPDRLPDGETVAVPGCWEAQVPDPFGIVHGWVWRDVVIPAEWPDEGELFVRFGAVMYRCEVWLNGSFVTEHEGGYTPFVAALTGVDRERPNRLALRVTNPMNAITEFPALSDERLDRAERRVPELPIREIPHGKQTWYASHSGVWRSVRLEWRPAQAIHALRARADWSTGDVRVSARTSETTGGTLELVVHGPAGDRVASASVPAQPVVEVVLTVPDRLGWDVGVPNLYRLEARLIVDGVALHEARTRFGFRQIRSKGGRVELNGRPILLRGALDQDVYPETIATPPSSAFLDRQMMLARDMGLNLLRCHIKIPDPAYLDAADEAGMLLWCEMPNWLRLTPDAARRGETLLDELVEAIGDHPSVVILTIINEDWGTDVRHSADDRQWLRAMVGRLRKLDPTRLVVDNSPCPTDRGPNFHLDTDIADFHQYAAMPDAAGRWADQMRVLAGRPDWLWSPHGDASVRGDEPVVLSEFGTWALPDPSSVRNTWWAGTGDGPARPAGLGDRFAAQRLDRVWGGPDQMAEATRSLQIESLRYQVGEVRRHSGMAGMVVTELTDAFWEANGLLTLERAPKNDPRRVAEIFGPTMLIVDMPRRDLWSGERLTIPVTLSSERTGDGGVLEWRLGAMHGSREVASWAASSPTSLGSISMTVPQTASTIEGEFTVQLLSEGVSVARSSLPVAIFPAGLRVADGLAVTVDDAIPGRDIRGLLLRDGHRVVDGGFPELSVTARLTAALRERVDGGCRALVIATSDDALPPDIELDRAVRVQPRWPAHAPGADFTWTGDWIGAFSWVLPGLSPDLPLRAPLGFVYQQVLPLHVLAGYEPVTHADEVSAGMFVGWVHAPVALLWRFRQGAGWLTVTTFDLGQDGPAATVLRHAILRHASQPPRAGRSASIDAERSPGERTS